MMKKPRTINPTKRAKRANPRSPKNTAEKTVGKLLAEFRQLMGVVDNAGSELEKNALVDRPAFNDWALQHLSTEFDRWETLQSIIVDLNSLIRELDTESRASGCRNPQLVYFRVITRRNSHRNAAASRTVADGDMEKKPIEPGGIKPSAQKEFKRLYRLLARRLHPDGNPDSDGKTSELWPFRQDAYRRRNLKRLRLLSLLTDQPGDSVDAKTHLIQMERALDQLRGSAKTVRRKRLCPSSSAKAGHEGRVG